MIARLRVSGLPLVAGVWLAIASCAAFAQTAPAVAVDPAVDQALRARVTEFLQGFVDRSFRKLLPLVAEDTQEEFFGMGKVELKSFKIDDIVYNKDFTKATVNCTVVKIWRWEGNELLPQLPLPTTWKIEDGKWVWFHELENDVMVTPMGPSDLSKILQKTDGGTLPPIPKISQSASDAMGRMLMQQASLDKSEVTLAVSKPSSGVVKVKNGAGGTVDLSLGAVPRIPGLTVELAKNRVDANETAEVQMRYDPPAGANKAQPTPVTFTVLVSPFNQQLVVHVKFADDQH